MILVKIILSHPQDIEDHHAEGAMHHFKAKANAELEDKVEDHVTSSDMQQTVCQVSPGSCQYAVPENLNPDYY